MLTSSSTLVGGAWGGREAGGSGGRGRGKGGGHKKETGPPGLVLQDGADGGKGTYFGSMSPNLPIPDFISNNFLWQVAWLKEHQRVVKNKITTNLCLFIISLEKELLVFNIIV